MTHRYAAVALAAFLAPPFFFAQRSPQLARTSLPQGAVTVGTSKWVISRPLPAFSLYTADDKPVPAQTIVQSGYWLVIYRDSICTQCDALMKILSQRTQAAHRFAFIVSDISGANLLLLEQQYPSLSQSLWLRDVNHAASTSMNISGTPHILGMRNDTIRWQHAGVAASDTTFPGVVDSWLKYNQLPPNQFVRTPLKTPSDQKPSSTANSAAANTADGAKK